MAFAKPCSRCSPIPDCRISFATIGSAILWAPFYAVADAAVLMARAAGAAVPRDGYSWPYLAAVCYGSAFYGFLAVLLGVRLATAFGFESAAQPDCGHRRLARDTPSSSTPTSPRSSLMPPPRSASPSF